MRRLTMLLDLPAVTRVLTNLEPYVAARVISFQQKPCSRSNPP